MKNIAVVITAIVVSVLLWGCPYQSQVPLGEATEKLNPQVIGTWLPRTEVEKQNPEYYVIEKRDSLHYRIDHHQYNENEQGYITKNYIGWTTRIDNLLFMNVQESGTNQFYLHRLDVMGDDLMILWQVTSNIDEKFTDSKAMHEFFRKHMKLSFFYNSDEVELVRKKN